MLLGVGSVTQLYHRLRVPPTAVGDLPKDLLQAAVRLKDLQYSSRTRLITLFMKRQRKLRGLPNELLTLIPKSERQSAIYQLTAQYSSAARRNVIHLVYRDKPYAGRRRESGSPRRPTARQLLALRPHNGQAAPRRIRGGGLVRQCKPDRRYLR